METITQTMNDAQIDNLRKRYASAHVCKTPPYARWQIKLSDCTITAYNSGKVVFQGEGAAIHAPHVDQVSRPVNKLTSSKKSDHPSSIVYPHIGSDEVGTGDYFGPVCVCAALVRESDLPLLEKLAVQDSKQINDAMIRKCAPQLMEQLTYSLLILDNQKYNLIHSTNNMNMIKAKLHNKAYLNLLSKMERLPGAIYLDQFTPETLYYRYLKGEAEIVRGIHFETKAENKFPAVACGSIIARYAFLKAMDDMEKRYDFTFPKGAGKQVDAAIREFRKRFDERELPFVAKLHFANTEKSK